MNSSQTNDSLSGNVVLHTIRGDSSYDDDGFFSDVPGSGSLSKSLVALNKYVKKNLLYDESDDYDNDSTYFSKESSPNYSRSKYDSDSVKSNDTDDTPMRSITITKVIALPGNEDEFTRHLENVTQLTDDYKSMHQLDKDSHNTDLNDKLPLKQNHPNNLEQENLKKQGNSITETNDILGSSLVCTKTKDSSVHMSKPKQHLPDISENDDCNFTEHIKHTESSNVFSELKLEHNNVILDSQNIKSQHENKPSSTPKYNVVCKLKHTKLHTFEDNNIDQQAGNYSISLNDLSNDSVSTNAQEKVALREKTRNESYSENRHTIHDFSDWGNRTNVYPDVYAPLPYKSPRRYVESDVNIHYRCPVRHDPLPLVPERELARQQAEHMKRLYREQRRNKYLQELQDMQNRRHQDNFTPSQKAVVPLNRYDEADKVIAKALYTFNGQTQRELSFRKGDLIHIRRQIDNNWYEGELHGRIGLFPYNYVEIQKGDVVQAPKKPVVVEGRARAKFDFTAQTNLELPLKKGEVVVLTRRIDQNWWEGKNGSKTGIFPDSYITVLQEPTQNKPESQPILSSDKPVASPAAHGLLNGSAKRSMGSHSYTPQPNSPALSNAPPATQPLPGYVAKPAQASLTPSERGYGPPTGQGVDLNNTEPLYVDTNAEAIPYRAMYKYRPQNPDELELNEGDTVYVLEKCDDGWYVGSSQRSGRFGTFPGNYVERI